MYKGQLKGHLKSMAPRPMSIPVRTVASSLNMTAPSAYNLLKETGTRWEHGSSDDGVM